MSLQTEGRVSAIGGLGGTLLLWTSVCAPTPSIGDVADPLMACTELSADTARLACFDREMREIMNHRPQPQTRPTPEQQFGLSSKQALSLQTGSSQPATPTVMHAHIANVLRAGYERQVFVLENSQSWQQIELDPDFTARNGQEVTISGGALGSFWLSTDSHHRTRVKRIR